MKIMRGHGLFGDMERLETGGSYCKDSIDVLHFAFDNQVRIIQDSCSLAIEDVRHNDGVRDTGFVFDTEKEQSFGGSGTLAADDAAGDPG